MSTSSPDANRQLGGVMANFLTSSKHALAAIVLASSGLLTACGGGGEGTASTSATDTGTSTSTGISGDASTAALTLSGSPLTSIAAGRSYSFAPTAAPATGASFSISNKPAWATFSTVTGALTGTPSAGDIGTFSNIVITASNGSANATLPAFTIAVTATTTNTGAATLSWSPPTQNTDGTAVDNLAGYNIYYGTSADKLTSKIQITNPGLTAYTVADLGAGTYYFAISAYTASGVEGDAAVVGSKTIS
jgi:hypothetical protein